jgi:hypothetical protein
MEADARNARCEGTKKRTDLNRTAVEGREVRRVGFCSGFRKSEFQLSVLNSDNALQKDSKKELC